MVVLGDRGWYQWADAFEESIPVPGGESLAVGTAPFAFDGRRSEIPQSRHRAWSVARADAAAVFVIGVIPDVVQNLNRPLSTDQPGDFSLVGAVLEEARDPEDHLMMHFSHARLDGVSFQPKPQRRTKDVECRHVEAQPGGSLLHPSMPLIDFAVRELASSL
jgi:hypothetical protein